MEVRVRESGGSQTERNPYKIDESINDIEYNLANVRDCGLPLPCSSECGTLCEQRLQAYR